MSRDFSKNTSNYMRLGANALGALFNGQAVLAIHMWAWFDSISTTSGDNALLTVWGTNASMNVRVAVHDGSNPVLRISSRPVAAETQRNVAGTSSLATGRWHSLGCVIDYPGDLITPYVNGAPENPTSSAFTATAYSTGTPTTSFDAIGSNGTPTAGTQVDGRIAELATWKVNIGAAAFRGLARRDKSPRDIRRDQLLGYWRLAGKGITARCEPGMPAAAVVGTITGSIPRQAPPPGIEIPRVLGRFGAGAA
jgi:hypothetical protein